MDNILTLLGLVYKAKKLVLGEEALNRMKDVKLLLIASDISEKSKERYLKKCYFYNVEYIDIFSAEELTNALGKTNVKVIGITDKGFAKSIISKIKK